MPYIDTRKNSILKKFKARVLKNIWESGEKIFVENKIQNISSSQKENSPTAYIQGEAETEGNIYIPSLYYNLKDNYVEVFTCTCQHKEKGPCEHVAALFISIIDKFYLKDEDAIDLKSLNSNKIVLLLKNFIKENEAENFSSITFKMQITDDKKIFLTDFHTRENNFYKIFKLMKTFFVFLNSCFEKESFTKYFEEKICPNLDAPSRTFLNAAENYFRENKEKIPEKDIFEIPEFLFPAFLPVFPYLCQNYISKEKEPEIFIFPKEDFFTFEIKDFEKWDSLGNDYMFFKSSDNFFKIIYFPDCEKKRKILNQFIQSNNLAFHKDENSLGTVITALKKIIKVRYSEEIASKYYIPEKIEYGILITDKDDKIVMVPKVIYDGKTKEQIEKTVLADKILENKRFEDAVNFIEKYHFFKEKDYYYSYCNNFRLFNFLSNEILKTPPDFHVVFNEKSKNARFVSGNISLEAIEKNNKIKIKISSDTFTNEEIAEIFSEHRNRSFIKLKNCSFLKVKNLDLLKIRHKVLSLNASYEEISAGEFYRPDIFSMFINGVSFTSMNMKNFIKDFSPDGFSLRSYQHYGVNWLLNMKSRNWGGILGDGAMLGKKLQILTFLYIQNFKNKAPNLILTHDMQEVFSWENEIKKFYKNINYKIIDNSLQKRIDFSDGEIIITTYSLHKENFSFFKNVNFENLILSRGELLKNLNSSVFKTILKTKRNTSYAVTNIPINFLFYEIWWTVSAAVPNYFPELKVFNNNFSLPKRKIIENAVAPLILRRDKKDVEKQLPEKLEKNIFFMLDTMQKKIYDALFSQYKNYFENNNKTEKEKLYSAFEDLKNTALISFKTALDKFEEKNTEKEEKLFSLLLSLCKNNYKIIVLSEFPSLVRLENKNLSRVFSWDFIKEDTSFKNVGRIIEEFNDEKIDILVLYSKMDLSNFKFCDVDAVVYFDPWHNENLEKYIENSDSKKIINYNFYALGTIEEKIYKLKTEKNFLNCNFEKDELLEFFK